MNAGIRNALTANPVPGLTLTLHSISGKLLLFHANSYVSVVKSTKHSVTAAAAFISQPSSVNKTLLICSRVVSFMILNVHSTA